MNTDVLAGLMAELPEGMVVTDPAVTDGYRQDRAFDPSAGKPLAIIRPRRACWVVRMLTSLLMFPGRDEADERAMIAEFVVPIVTPASAAARKAGHPGPE